MNLFVATIYTALPRHGLLDASATFLDSSLFHAVHDGAQLLANFMTSIF